MEDFGCRYAQETSGCEVAFFILACKYRTFFLLVFIKNRSRVSQGIFFLNIVEILSEFPLQIVFCNKTETFHNHFESLKNKQR